MTFQVKKHWAGKFPHFNKPKAIGYFSIDGTRSISFDSSQLHYYSPPIHDEEVHFNLNKGIDMVKRKPASADNEKLDHLLKWIQQNLPSIRANPESKQWLKPNFICWRGLLTKIMITPYNPKDGWIICASKWRGTIYLCAFDTEKDKHEKLNLTPRQLQFMSWGFKFEQYILTDAPMQPPDTSKPVNEAEEFGCIFLSNLKDNCLLYGAEMDGVYSKELLTDPLPIGDLQFIELKTSRRIETSNQSNNLKKFKFIKWWCQSFLVGIENILCGYRDDKGIVEQLENHRVSELARMSKTFWCASDCMNFCDAFLQYITKTVINDCDKTVYKFERLPFGDICMTELPPSSEYAFLPMWFLKSTD